MKFYEFGSETAPALLLLPGFMQKRLAKKPPEDRTYYEKMLDLSGMNNTWMAFVQRDSIHNQFYSDLVTPIADDISVPGTEGIPFVKPWKTVLIKWGLAMLAGP